MHTLEVQADTREGIHTSLGWQRLRSKPIVGCIVCSLVVLVVFSRNSFSGGVPASSPWESACPIAQAESYPFTKTQKNWDYNPYKKWADECTLSPQEKTWAGNCHDGPESGQFMGVMPLADKEDVANLSLMHLVDPVWSGAHVSLPLHAASDNDTAKQRLGEVFTYLKSKFEYDDHSQAAPWAPEVMRHCCREEPGAPCNELTGGRTCDDDKHQQLLLFSPTIDALQNAANAQFCKAPTDDAHCMWDFKGHKPHVSLRSPRRVFPNSVADDWANKLRAVSWYIVLAQFHDYEFCILERFRVQLQEPDVEALPS